MGVEEVVRWCGLIYILLDFIAISPFERISAIF